MVDSLAFQRMIMPVPAQVFFWIGVVASLVIGLAVIATGSASNRLMGITMLGGGPLVASISCKLLVPLFRMNEALDDSRSSLTPPRE